MKIGIHPNYNIVTVSCACGNKFTTGSTRKDLKLEICSGCHPFFTGKQKFVDTEGRIDKFLKKFDQAKVHREDVKAERAEKVKAAARAARLAPAMPKKPKILSTKPVGAAKKGKK